MDLTIQQTVRHSLDILKSPTKSEQEKIGALKAALDAIEQLQNLEKSNPKLFARVKKALEEQAHKSVGIDDLQP